MTLDKLIHRLETYRRRHPKAGNKPVMAYRNNGKRTVIRHSVESVMYDSGIGGHPGPMVLFRIDWEGEKS